MLWGNYAGYRQHIEKLAGIASSSYDKYRKILRSVELGKDQSVAALNTRIVGRPPHYSSEGDAMFWRWLSSPERKLKEKTMENMIKEYKSLTGTENVTRQHISFLLHQKRLEDGYSQNS